MPVTTAVKVALPPALTLNDVGWVVNEGAVLTVSVALLEETVETEFVALTE